jgi:hypothetical protein
MFYGVKKDKLELEALRDQLKRFFDHDYKRTFILFPPIVKRANRQHRRAYLENDEETKSLDTIS